MELGNIRIHRVGKKVDFDLNSKGRTGFTFEIVVDEKGTGIFLELEAERDDAFAPGAAYDLKIVKGN